MRVNWNSRTVIGFAGLVFLLGATILYADVRWPLPPQNQTYRLWCAYGTLQDFGFHHFHEGIDLPVPDSSEPPVLAVENGTVEEIYLVHGNADFITCSRADDPTKGWCYVHIDLGYNLEFGRKWEVGDAVVQGSWLGDVHDHTGLMDHLHFQAVNNSNGDCWHPGGYPLADVQGDPLDFLTPNTDNEPPVIVKSNDHFYYRKGDHEGNPNAEYFDSEIDAKLVISDNVDIIVRAYDTFGAHRLLDYDVGVKKIQFSVTGQRNIPTQVLEDFSGLFLIREHPDGRNARAEFLSLERTHTIYEDDNTAGSRGHTPGAGGVSQNEGEYYYIMTNKDDDDDNEFLDSVRYWDTDGKKGEAWNDIDDNPAHEARNNADAQFPDGVYTVTVTAFSLGSSSNKAPLDTSEFDSVYVNNFSQTIDPDQYVYEGGEPVWVTGTQYLPQTGYTIYLISRDTWPDHAPIPHGAVITMTSVTTDLDGNIPDTLIWASYVPNGVGYDIVVDYDGDGEYHLPRNGKTIDALDYIYEVVSVSMECRNLTPTFCRGKNLYFSVTVINNTGAPVQGVLTFSGYFAYDCDPGNILVSIPRMRFFPDGVSVYYYFFKVPHAVAPGQYSASISGTLGGYEVFCCMNTDIIQCGPWRIGDNTEWELVEVERPEVELPMFTSLSQNYPNPFNVSTNMSYTLAEAGKVTLKVYDIAGRLVQTLVDERQEAGEYTVTWDASEVSSGVYFYKLTAGDYTLTKKMNLLK